MREKRMFVDKRVRIHQRNRVGKGSLGSPTPSPSPWYSTESPAKYEIKTCGEHTVQYLKLLLFQETDIDPSAQLLFYGDLLLTDEKRCASRHVAMLMNSLYEYDIVEGAVLSLEVDQSVAQNPFGMKPTKESAFVSRIFSHYSSLEEGFGGSNLVRGTATQENRLTSSTATPFKPESTAWTEIDKWACATCTFTNPSSRSTWYDLCSLPLLICK